MRKACAPHVRGTGSFDDMFFRIKAREKRRTHQGQRTNQEGNPRDRHVLAQAAHVANILIVVHADNHRARTQKQQGFKEGMGH